VELDSHQRRAPTPGRPDPYHSTTAASWSKPGRRRKETTYLSADPSTVRATHSTDRFKRTGFNLTKDKNKV
jgi:hypothetical protein